MLKRFATAFLGLFAPIAGSIHGALILPEVLRAVAAGLTAGGGFAGLAVGLNVLAVDAPSLTASQTLAAVCAFTFTQLAALFAQLGQSKPIVPPPIELLKSTALPDALPQALIGRHPVFGTFSLYPNTAFPKLPIFHDLKGFAAWELAGRPPLKPDPDLSS